MRVFYFDTSALVKRYVVEQGSHWVNTLLDADEKPITFTSNLTLIEATCAFARRAREGSLPDQALKDILQFFKYDFEQYYHVLDVVPATIEIAQELALAHPLRAYDAVQLATAHLANQQLIDNDKPPLTFVSADIRLTDIAHESGLIADNPIDHA